MTDIERARARAKAAAAERVDAERAAHILRAAEYCERTSKKCDSCIYQDCYAANEKEAAFNLALAALREKQWIPVSERLPEDDKELYFYEDTHLKFTSVLACGYSYHDSTKPHVAEVNRILDKEKGDAWHWSNHFDRITHWRPLPEPPEGGAE